MQIDDLKRVVCFGIPNSVDWVCLAAGPITRQPNTNVSRRILAIAGTKLAVWLQTWEGDEYSLHKGLRPITDGGMSDGYYFEADEFALAMRQFGTLVASDSSNVNSIYRGLGG